jgi:hypothetical protein
MNYKRRNLLAWLGLMMLTSMLLVPIGCINQGSPLMTLVIENQTEQELIIFMHNENIGEVKSGARITLTTDLNMGEYPVEAKNAQGKIVFSETFTFMPDDKYHLQKIEDRVYKAVIPPLENGSESSANATGG